MYRDDFVYSKKYEKFNKEVLKNKLVKKMFYVPQIQMYQNCQLSILPLLKKK